MGIGKLVYPSSDSEQYTYTFPRSYNLDYSVSYIETDDRQRSLDGSLNFYAGALKKVWTVNFNFISHTQKEELLRIYSYKCLIDLYLDGSTLDGVVRMVSPGPQMIGEEAHDEDGDQLWSCSIQFEEV